MSVSTCFGPGAAVKGQCCVGAEEPESHRGGKIPRQLMAQVLAVAAVTAVVAAVVEEGGNCLSLRLSSVTQESVSAGLSEGRL